MIAVAKDEAPLPDEFVLSELSASLEVLVSPDESSLEDDPPPPPPPPPPQEIKRILIIITIMEKIGNFIIYILILRYISSSQC